MKTRVPDIIKATRKCNREAQFEIYGPGFHTFHKVVKSKKVYSRAASKAQLRSACQ